MSKRDFFRSTPKDIRYVMDAYSEGITNRADEIKYSAWLNGKYVCAAVAAVLSSKNHYPDSPLESEKKSVKKTAESHGKTESQLNQELLMMSLQVRQANANIAKARKEREDGAQE